MIVYRDQRARADPRRLLAQLRAHLESLDPSSHDDVVDAFIAGGILESAVADQLFPQIDGMDPLARRLRVAALALGHMLWHSWRGDRDAASGWRDAAVRRLQGPELQYFPASVRVNVPEGYAYYGLYPETYLEAARRYHQARTPGEVVCIGLRSIGASLSAGVAAALEELGARVRSITLRPRGEPFSRAPILSRGLAEELFQNRAAHFLLVDEGPGLSGSSLAGTAELVSRAGVPDDRIVLFPSHLTDGSRLRSVEARERWKRHPQFSVSFEELWAEGNGPALSLPLLGAEDISAGAWRKRLYSCESEYPPVQPQHERRKYLLRDGPDDPEPRLASFFGLGRRAQAKLSRASRLAAAGFTPGPERLVHGFIFRRFIPGRPLQRGETSPELLETVARYLSHLFHEHRAEPTTSRQSLLEMTSDNLREALGDGLEPVIARRAPALKLEAECPVSLDARMQAHEWIRTASGYIKVDPFDHHDDHFFPGCQDIAWDLAGAKFELNPGPAGSSFLVERYRRLSGDHTIGLRLPHYGLAYLAFRLGYSRLAATVLSGTPDGLRFQSAAERYSALVRRELQWPVEKASHV
jgi:hypothetical protein